MKKTGIALLVLMFCFPLCAQTTITSGASLKHPKNASYSTDNAEKKADSAPRNPFPVPLPITVVQPPEDTAHGGDREAKLDEFNKNYLDSQIRIAKSSENQSRASFAAATIVFIEAIIAGFALCFLMKTYRETMIAARGALRSAHAATKAAKAAELSAKAAMGVALPALILSHVDFEDSGAATLDAILQSPNIVVRFKNYGTTFAVAKWQSVVITCTNTLPESPAYSPIIPIPYAGMVIEKGIEWALEVVARPFLSSEEIEAIKNGGKILWVYGFAAYSDFLGDPHERRFCQRLYVTRTGYSFGEDMNTPKQYTEKQ